MAEGGATDGAGGFLGTTAGMVPAVTATDLPVTCCGGGR